MQSNPTIYDQLISKLNSICNLPPNCVTWHIHRFWEGRHGHLWGEGIILQIIFTEVIRFGSLHGIEIWVGC